MTFEQHDVPCSEVGRVESRGDVHPALQRPVPEGEILDIKPSRAVFDRDLARDARRENALAVRDEAGIRYVRRACAGKKAYEERRRDVKILPQPAENSKTGAYPDAERQRYEPVKMGHGIERFGDEYPCGKRQREETDGSAIEDPPASHVHFAG